jgi:hypothetical protein
LKTKLRFLSAAILACAVSTRILPAATEPGVAWQIRHPDATRMNLIGVASNGTDRVVAVGANGTIRVSGDHGATWTEESTHNSHTLHSIAWTGTHFVAVGGLGDEACTILHSPDGAEWTIIGLGGKTALRGVAASPAATVAVGTHGLIVRSTDLTMWNDETDADATLHDVLWTGGQFVAVGDRGLAETSPDGITWTQRTNGLAGNMFLNSLAWNGSTLVAVGVEAGFGVKPLLIVSADGIDWTKAALPIIIPAPEFRLNTVEWTGTQFVAMGDDGHTLTSADGITWFHSGGGIGIDINGLCMDGGNLISVGSHGAIPGSGAIPAPTRKLNDIAAGPTASAGLAVATGDNGTILVSDNEFSTIAVRTSGTEQDLNGATAAPLASARFIAVGARGTILTSSDAAAWTTQASGTVATLRAIAWFEPVGIIAKASAIAVGDAGTILTSTTATAWTAQTSTATENLRDVAVGHVLKKPAGLVTRIVAVGDNGTIIHSLNGSAWHAAAPLGTSSILVAVAALNQGFAAVSFQGEILKSPDGIDWTIEQIDPEFHFLDILWTGSQLVATGTNGLVLTSPDGSQWTRRHTRTSEFLQTAAVLGSGRLCIAGSSEMILVSDSSIDFQEWISYQSPPPGQGGPDDDPNGDGITNLLAAALDIPAVDPPEADDFAALPRITDPAPGRRMTIRLRPGHTTIGDIAYVCETSSTLEPESWTPIHRSEPGQQFGNGSLDIVIPPPPSSTMFLVLPEPLGAHERHFARMRIEFTD